MLLKSGKKKKSTAYHLYSLEALNTNEEAQRCSNFPQTLQIVPKGRPEPNISISRTLFFNISFTMMKCFLLSKSAKDKPNNHVNQKLVNYNPEPILHLYITLLTISLCIAQWKSRPQKCPKENRKIRLFSEQLITYLCLW